MGKKERKDEAEEDRSEEPVEEKKSRKSKKEKEKEKEKEQAPKKTSLGDSGTMKRMLDDAVIKACHPRRPPKWARRCLDLPPISRCCWTPAAWRMRRIQASPT